MSIQGSNDVTYGVVYHVLGTRIVVYVDGDAAQGRDLGRQLIQTRVILSFALICFRHVGLIVDVELRVVRGVFEVCVEVMKRSRGTPSLFAIDK